MCLTNYFQEGGKSMFKKRVALFLIPLLLVAGLAFAFTRDWDETDPIDHTLNSKWPAEIREVMTDVSERLTDSFYGFASGETLIGIKDLIFHVQGSDPGATADAITCYSKDVSAKAEFFCQDEDANVIQITDAGSLKVAQAQVCEFSYPVGHVYIATVATNPSTLLGCGTWAAWGAGRVIVSLDGGDGDFDTSEETGGSKTHTLSEAEMPSHIHGYTTNLSGTPGSGNAQSSDNGSTGYAKTVTSSGGDTAHNNVQPYIVAYMWERTS